MLARSCSDAGQNIWDNLLINRTKVGTFDVGEEDELIVVLMQSCISIAYEFVREPVIPATTGDTSDVLLCRLDNYLRGKREREEITAKNMLNVDAIASQTVASNSSKKAKHSKETSDSQALAKEEAAKKRREKDEQVASLDSLQSKIGKVIEVMMAGEESKEDTTFRSDGAKILTF